MKAAVLTLGCKVNQAESSSIEGALKQGGWEIVDLKGRPEFCIVNTCSVTSKSDYQSRQLIRRARKHGARVIVTGCYSALNRETVLSMEGVSAVVDNKDKIKEIAGIMGCTRGADAQELSGRSRYFLKIQDGCNFNCSYCIIPKARGRSLSLPVDAVIEKMRGVAEGYSEVVLTGIHLGTYGYDLSPQVKLSDLLERILQATSIKRVRLSSLEIKEIDDKLLDLMHDLRVCGHLHVPLQSGDDSILKRMNRQYTTSEFARRISNISERLPNVSLGTDVIVGFPGEGEREFGNSVAYVQTLPFSYLHIFPFSGRPGTPASEMPSQVEPGTKKGRCSVLEEVSGRMKRVYAGLQLGRTLDLLIEEQLTEGLWRGTTGNYMKVEASLGGSLTGDIVAVRIEGLRGGILLGKPVGRP